MTKQSSTESARDFAGTLSARYREHTDAGTVIAHAHVAANRGSAVAGVGLFSTKRPSAGALCIVADDRPGLLATISAALVSHNWDVIDAEAYTRKNPAGRAEAVDLFWVQRSNNEHPLDPMSEAEVAALRDTLIGFISGHVDPKTVTPSHAPAIAPRCETVVRFIEGRDGAFATLEVEATDRPGLLLGLAKALFDKKLQIVSSEVRTKNGQVFDRFDVTEQDGSPIKPERRLEVQVAVITAVESAMGRGN